MCTCDCLIKCEHEWTDMSEQMLKMKLQHLTNMGNWETGNMYNMYSVQYIQYVQCEKYCIDMRKTGFLFYAIPLKLKLEFSILLDNFEVYEITELTYYYFLSNALHKNHQEVWNWRGVTNLTPSLSRIFSPTESVMLISSLQVAWFLHYLKLLEAVSNLQSTVMESFLP